MLPRLQAEESLTRVAELQAGDSMIDVSARERIIGAWREVAEGPRPKLTPEQEAMELALLGITVTTVKAGG